MFNEMIVVSVTPFSGTTTADKNGENPVMLQLIAGKMPNRNVLSGTLAKRAGIEVNKTYLMNVREAGIDKVFGVDFTFTKVHELTSALDIVQASKELGSPVIIQVERPEGYENNYERKSDAVEGQKTIREKEGLYKRSQPSTTLEHENAKEVKRGSSTDTEELFGKTDKDKKLAS